MAAHSNRSPSPLSSRPTNPNPRNSENIPPSRRSFSGNNAFAKPSVLSNPRRFDPNTPANSPLDYAGRRSVSKDCEEKENVDNLLKASKLQSPAKGSKNFMSPTISAASKFTPSPRKKVLVERNDPVRTSISLSDGKAIFFSTMSSNISDDMDSKSELGHPQNPKLETSVEPNVADLEKNKPFQEDPPVPKPSKRVSFSDVPSDSQPVTQSLSESVISVKINMPCSSPSPSIAPLDADPSLPPYDPKTNYLSPRPQFLHYKPNPRIDVLLNKENGLTLDEFAEIMSLSESECTEGSPSDDDSNKDETEVTVPHDMVVGVEETVEVPHVSESSESLPVSTSLTPDLPEENIVQKNKKKQWGFSRLICFSILMMFFIACIPISVTHSPSLDEFDFSLSDLKSWYHQSRDAVTAKVNYDQLARHVNELSVNSVSFISSLAIDLGIGQKVGPLQYMNISYKVNEEPIENLEEDDELEEDQDTQTGTFEEEYADVDSEEAFEEELETQEEEEFVESEQVSPDSVKLEKLESEYSEDMQIQIEDVVSSIITPQCSEIKAEDQLGAIPQDQESALLEADVEVATTNIDTNFGSLDQLAATPLNQESELLEAVAEDASANVDTNLGLSSVDSLSEGVESPIILESAQSEGKLVAHYVVGVSSLFAAVVAVAAAFMYQHKRNAVQVYPLSTTQTPIGFAGRKQHTYQEKEFSKNRETEMDGISESSCPSEMSSYQKSASYSKNEQRGTGEVQSIERKTRKYSKRESLASSSTEISIKHTNGEEEIVTPVRRSSRLRNHHVTSP